MPNTELSSDMSLNRNTGDPSFNFNNIIAKGGAPELKYKEGTVLYGVARKGTDWKGVRFEFK